MNTINVIIGIVGIVTIIVLIYSYRENVKKGFQERIEKNAVKIPNISYADKKGKIHTEDIVIKKSNFPLIGDWSRVYPPLNEDNSWNLINLIFGGKKNFIKFLAMFGILIIIGFAFYEIFSQYEALKNMCEQFLNLQEKNLSAIP